MLNDQRPAEWVGINSRRRRKLSQHGASKFGSPFVGGSPVLGVRDMTASHFRSRLHRANATLAQRVLSELSQRSCSDNTLVRAVRNCVEMGQGRLTVALYEGHRAMQTAPLKPELAAQLIRSLGRERPPYLWAAAALTPSKDHERAVLLRLAFRVMGDTRSADAAEPPHGDPCAVDLEPTRGQRQRRGGEPNRWLGEISSEVAAALLATCAQSGDVARAMELYDRAFEQRGRVLPQRPMSALLEVAPHPLLCSTLCTLQHPLHSAAPSALCSTLCTLEHPLHSAAPSAASSIHRHHNRHRLCRHRHRHPHLRPRPYGRPSSWLASVPRGCGYGAWLRRGDCACRGARCCGCCG